MLDDNGNQRTQFGPGGWYGVYFLNDKEWELDAVYRPETPPGKLQLAFAANGPDCYNQTDPLVQGVPYAKGEDYMTVNVSFFDSVEVIHVFVSQSVRGLVLCQRYRSRLLPGYTS